MTALGQLTATGGIDQHFRTVADNMGVVNSVSHPTPAQGMHRRFHAGLLRELAMLESWPLLRGQAVHIRSHQLDRNPGRLAEVSEGERRALLGNQLADRTAEEAKATHPPLHPTRLAIDKMAHRVAGKVVKLAGKIMPLHPRRAKHERQAAATASGAHRGSRLT